MGSLHDIHLYMCTVLPADVTMTDGVIDNLTNDVLEARYRHDHGALLRAGMRAARYLIDYSSFSWERSPRIDRSLLSALVRLKVNFCQGTAKLACYRL